MAIQITLKMKSNNFGLGNNAHSKKLNKSKTTKNSLCDESLEFFWNGLMTNNGIYRVRKIIVEYGIIFKKKLHKRSDYPYKSHSNFMYLKWKNLCYSLVSWSNIFN